ncbi:hypothetical protein LJ655_09075 [Paraburkholderia sp. MMS20-SJTN17]|uniref:Uncharacterized protein n=1 Tax=Paraburkholderia translucens TaxID=2886945 RepID=A0ABS8KC97_9BURK|nr:hypothetical protein [Paraburkholderia sp. MMS20-SJTN17]MCC8402042.1 hypothetical protein [Paraburkholderia sp. MMS20-SJTN17]
MMQPLDAGLRHFIGGQLSRPDAVCSDAVFVLDEIAEPVQGKSLCAAISMTGRFSGDSHLATRV